MFVLLLQKIIEEITNPNAESDLKKIMINVYSKLVVLDKKKLMLITDRLTKAVFQKPNEEVVKSVLRTFKNKNSLFEQLYGNTK